MSEHSIDAYIRDVQKLASLEEIIEQKISPEQVRQEHIEIFIGRIYEVGLGEKTQARIISGLKSFFKYLMLEDLIVQSPMELI